MSKVTAVEVEEVVVGKCIILQDGEIFYSGGIGGAAELPSEVSGVVKVLLNPVDYRDFGAFLERRKRRQH